MKRGVELAGRRRARLLASLCGLLLPWPASPAEAQQRGDARVVSQCVRCHAAQRDPRLRAPAEALAASVHGEVDLTCHDCHGGLPDEPTARAHAPRAGFRAGLGPDGDGKTAQVCGPCHASDEPMRERPPADVAPSEASPLAHYLKSRHAAALAEGRPGATCADCHGSHDVRALDDPESRVARSHVADTCAGCHDDPARMGASGLPHDARALWRDSVHGRRFAKDPGPDAERHPPTCTDCHGTHAIEHGEAGVAGCEHCHDPQWTAFNGSAHASAFARKGFLPCVDCHGSHGVQEAGLQLIGVERGAACRRCHADGQEMFDTIAEFARDTRGAETLAKRAMGGPAERAPGGPLDALRHARGALRLALHGLDVEQVRQAAEALRALAAPLAGATTEKPSASEASSTNVAGPTHEAATETTTTRTRRWLAYGLFALGLGALLAAALQRRSRRQP